MTKTTVYEELIASASRLTGINALVDLENADVAVTASLLHQNLSALESARNALRPECAVPVRYEQAFFSEHIIHFSYLRNLAHAFHAEAWLATIKNDYQAAAQIGLENLKLANAVRRGGLVTDLLVGIAISAMSLNAIRKIRDKFDRRTRHLIMDELHRLDAEREPFASIITRDRDWERAVGLEDNPSDLLLEAEANGLSDEEHKEVLRALQRVADLPKSAKQKMEQDQDNHIVALMRMLAVDLALRDYCETIGSLPNELSELIPLQVSKLPLDPFSEKPFLYRCHGGKAFSLYSAGPKRVDGGGHFGAWPSVESGYADLCLDAADYDPVSCILQRPIGLTQRMKSRIRKWLHSWRW